MLSTKRCVQALAELSGMEVLLRHSARNQPRILMYHRIVDEPYVSGVTPAQFDRQMAYVAKKYRVVPIDQLVLELKTGTVKPNTLALTFDDGYFDFYKNAWPILRRYELPASLYITTGFVDQSQWLWPDILKYILINAKNKKIVVEMLGEYDLDRSSVLWVWEKISDRLLGLQELQRAEFINEVACCVGVDVPDSTVLPFTSVTWDQLKEMKEQGLDVGSHTVTHSILSRLDASHVSEELGRSAQRISQELGEVPSGICYPNGLAGDVSGAVLDCAERLGYTYGVMAFNAAVNAGSIYRLGRIPAAYDYADFRWRLMSGK